MKPKKLTAHELARLLLACPDDPVVIFGADSDGTESLGGVSSVQALTAEQVEQEDRHYWSFQADQKGGRVLIK